jgi:hypothetical protein
MGYRLLRVAVLAALVGCEQPSPPRAPNILLADDPPPSPRLVPDACKRETELAAFTACIRTAGLRGEDAARAVNGWLAWRKSLVEDEKRRAEEAAAAKAKAEEDARLAEEMRVTKVRAWRATASDRCAAALARVGCAPVPAEATEDDVLACSRDCADAIEKRLESRFADAREACVEKFVAAAGKGKFACELVALPESAELKGDALKARVDVCSKTCATLGPDALKEARERARREAEERKAAEAARKAEEAKAAQRARDNAIGRELAIAFHKCAVAADSSYTMRKYQAYDCPLYFAEMQKAVEGCYDRNRCDWVAEHSDYHCVYPLSC